METVILVTEICFEQARNGCGKHDVDWTLSLPKLVEDLHGERVLTFP
jgi:hypothetical protein